MIGLTEGEPLPSIFFRFDNQVDAVATSQTAVRNKVRILVRNNVQKR
jgi:hypothetical protein